MKQVILGAGGTIGMQLASVLVNYSSDIRLVNRNPKKVNRSDSLFPADITDRGDVFRAVRGTDIVYLTVGLPFRTKDWRKYWMHIVQNVVEACLLYGTKLVYFDNVYAIGGNDIYHICEESPICPTSKKGEIRASACRYILRHIADSGLEAIIARAPDFYGGQRYNNSILMQMVYARMADGKKAQWLCNAAVPHSMAYVPDLANGLAILGNSQHAFNQVWNLPVDPYALTGEQWIALFAEGLRTDPEFTIIPGWAVDGLGLFNPVLRELADIKYQFERDFYFDSTKFCNQFSYIPVKPENGVLAAIADARSADLNYLIRN